jgi:phosphohistidine phosphatase
LEYSLSGMNNAKIDLIFFRHGLADWPDWRGDDDNRPLDEAGKKETHEVAAFLATLRLKPKKIITSPLPRAAQTAEIVFKHLRVPLVTSESLTPGFTARDLKSLLAKEKAGVVMLVGHEPDFSEVIAKLTGGDVKMKKSGVARVRIDRKRMRGQLRWLLSPVLCKRAAL